MTQRRITVRWQVISIHETGMTVGDGVDLADNAEVEAIIADLIALTSHDTALAAEVTVLNVKPAPATPSCEVILTAEAYGDEGGVETMRCPHCLNTEIVEVDIARRWNPMQYNQGGSLSIAQQQADFETDRFLCVSCRQEVMLPDWLAGQMDWY